MLIIFDGPDNSGKTTIAQALAKEIEYPYFRHRGTNKDNYKKQLSDYYRFLVN